MHKLNRMFERERSENGWYWTAVHLLILLLWEKTTTAIRPTDMPCHGREHFALGGWRVAWIMRQPTSCRGPPVTAHDSNSPGERKEEKTESYWETDGKIKSVAGSKKEPELWMEKLYCGRAGKLPTVKVNKIKCKCAVNGGVPKA